MKAFALATSLVAISSPALADQVSQGYECRYEGNDAQGYRITGIGHILTSDINGEFETRVLGMPFSNAPSAQIYTWQQGSDQERKLYIELYDNHDETRLNSTLVNVSTPEVSIELSVRGANAVLTCKSF